MLRQFKLSIAACNCEEIIKTCRRLEEVRHLSPAIALAAFHRIAGCEDRSEASGDAMFERLVEVVALSII